VYLSGTLTDAPNSRADRHLRTGAEGFQMRCARVVLADRHPSMLEGIRRLLETEAESVLMVADEVSLVQAVERTLPDLVIADFSFPVCGGTNVVRLLKQRSPGIKIIILSADDDPVVVGEIVEAGAEGFVLKRRAVVDLISAIREVCRGRRYVSPVVED
jgi:DNA-binding NarL/FixJ family response regulator